MNIPLRTKIIIPALFLLCARLCPGVQALSPGRAGDPAITAQAVAAELPRFKVDATSAILMNALSGQTLFEQNSGEKMAPASLVKLMTLYLAYDALKTGLVKIDDAVLISKKAWETQGSKMFVEVGTRVELQKLLEGIAAVSGNDACIAVAEHIAGIEEAFVARMNEKARSLGLSHTHEDYSPERRIHFALEQTPLSRDDFHSLMTMYRHPKWHGRIKRVRLSLAPGESEVAFEIDSFFTVYDTRHTINNPIFILAACRYFNWTGDLDFLRRQIHRLRLALRYQQTVLGGLQYNRIRNPWPGHDGLPSWHKDPQGKLTFHPGHGIGNNYWDILPFGWDDAHAANQYYAATIAMAELEEAIQQRSDWNMPLGALSLDPTQLRRHAAQVKETANRLFWNETHGRFVACIDRDGHPHDYGYTFLNLDAIWYDLATPDHARHILDWITGQRIVSGDTSTGEDIYRWRFGPRATTRLTVDWHGQGWWAPETTRVGSCR